MDKQSMTFSLFTKPWKNLSIAQLGDFVKGLGFNGIEFPVRPGYQVEPENAVKGLPLIAAQLKGYGISITSIAAAAEETIFYACAEAGVPVIRIMGDVNTNEGYMACEARMKRKIDGFLPLCAKYNIKVGIQHHYGPMVSNSMEMLHLIEKYDKRYIGAIWDAAHSGLAGEEPEQGLDIVWPYLCMVNFKTAFYKRINGPEAEEAVWERYFTTGRHGLTSWSRAAEYLKARRYDGVICLPAEYTDEKNVNKYIAEDMEYVRKLFK